MVKTLSGCTVRFRKLELRHPSYHDTFHIYFTLLTVWSLIMFHDVLLPPPSPIKADLLSVLPNYRLYRKLDPEVPTQTKHNHPSIPLIHPFTSNRDLFPVLVLVDPLTPHNIQITFTPFQ